MDNKENANKKFMKRRSVGYDDHVTLRKRMSDISTNSDWQINDKELNSDFLSGNSKAIHSTCLTGNFKNRCSLGNIPENCDERLLGTPEEQIIPLKEFKNLPIDLETHNSTPKEQIVPLAEFRNLSKLDTILIDKMSSKDTGVKKLVFINNSDNNNLELDDSFEMIQNPLTKSQSMKFESRFHPTFLTPETPCDINNIDLEINIPIVPLQNSDSNKQYRPKKHLPRSLSLESPIFYEANKKPKRNPRQLKPKLSDPGDLKLYAEMSANVSRIEEISVDFVTQIIEEDFTLDSFAYHIIDCRYPYEYHGGHVRSAVNLYTPWQLLNYVFFANYNLDLLQRPLEDPQTMLHKLVDNIIRIEKPKSKWKCQAFIFHCEFSSIRGPEMARCFRNIDRISNFRFYPHLHFPKVFIMKGGYKEFYSKCKNWCEPQNYVPMEINNPIHNKMDSEFENQTVDGHIDDDLRKDHLKQYNVCKKECQEQIHLLSKYTMKSDD